jgi:hypothetical protein
MQNLNNNSDNTKNLKNQNRKVEMVPKVDHYIKKVERFLSPILDFSVEIVLLLLLTYIKIKMEVLKLHFSDLTKSINLNKSKEDRQIKSILNQLLGYTQAERIIYTRITDNRKISYEELINGHKSIRKEYDKIADKHLNSYRDYLINQRQKFEKYDFENYVSKIVKDTLPSDVNSFHPLVSHHINYAVVKCITILLETGLLDLHYCSNTTIQQTAFNKLDLDDKTLKEYLFRLENL